MRIVIKKIETGDWAAHAQEALGRVGHRQGGARTAVVELLAGEDCCLSAQEVADRLSAGGRRVGLASVYRTLDLLHEMGLVQRLAVGAGGWRFEPRLPDGEHHHHVVCDSCGRLARFEDDGLEAAIDGVAERLRHSVSYHDVLIHGQCPRCARGYGSRASAQG
jgi:Fur family ferric uptake transcriptional regulator